MNNVRSPRKVGEINKGVPIQEIVNGKHSILLFRELSKASEKPADIMLFQEEHTFSYEREYDKVVTKSGVVLKQGNLDTEVEIEAIQAVYDPVQEFLERSVIDGIKLELWQVNTDPRVKNEDGEYPAIYVQGYLSTWEPASPAEDEPDISGAFMVEYEPTFGWTKLSEVQESAVQAAYGFRDTDVHKEGVESRSAGIDLFNETDEKKTDKK